MQKTILTTLSFQEATKNFKYVTAAELHPAIQERLRAGIAHFTFKKADGSVREAYGTLAPGLIPERPMTTEQAEAKLANKPKPENPNVQTYYDLGAQDWRAYTISKVIALF
jgi:hypothetical protein